MNRLKQSNLFFYALHYRCVEVVKASQYVELANDLEINKAITYLRQKDFNQVSFKKFHMLIGQSNNIGKLLSRIVFAVIILKLSNIFTSVF